MTEEASGRPARIALGAGIVAVIVAACAAALVPEVVARVRFRKWRQMVAAAQSPQAALMPPSGSGSLIFEPERELEVLRAVGPRAVRLLRQAALRDPEPYVRKAAVSTLAELFPDGEETEPHPDGEAGSAGFPGATDAMAELARTADPETRLLAIRELGEAALWDARCVADLAAIASGPAGDDRQEALTTLFELARDRGTPEARRALEDLARAPGGADAQALAKELPPENPRGNEDR